MDGMNFRQRRYDEAIKLVIQEIKLGQSEEKVYQMSVASTLADKAQCLDGLGGGGAKVSDFKGAYGVVCVGVMAHTYTYICTSLSVPQKQKGKKKGHHLATDVNDIDGYNPVDSLTEQMQVIRYYSVVSCMSCINELCKMICHLVSHHPLYMSTERGQGSLCSARGGYGAAKAPSPGGYGNEESVP